MVWEKTATNRWPHGSGLWFSRMQATARKLRPRGFLYQRKLASNQLPHTLITGISHKPPRLKTSS